MPVSGRRTGSEEKVLSPSPVARAVLFDFGGTLDADGWWWSVRFHRAYLAEGGGLSFEDFDPRFKDSDRALGQYPGIDGLGFREMVRTQAELLLPLLPDGARVRGARIGERFYSEALAVVARNRPVIVDLHRRYRLGVVSNFTGNLDRCLSELGLADYFAVALDSAVIGVAKPDPRIFVEALRIIRSAPEETWMVGDNLETDIRPAARLGLHTCWLTPSERPAPTDAQPTARISTLTALPDILP